MDVYHLHEGIPENGMAIVLFLMRKEVRGLLASGTTSQDLDSIRKAVVRNDLSTIIGVVDETITRLNRDEAKANDLAAFEFFATVSGERAFHTALVSLRASLARATQESINWSNVIENCKRNRVELPSKNK